MAATQTLCTMMVLCCILSGCGDFPRDPKDSLHQAIDRGALRVGLSEHPPWVYRTDDGRPAGAEADLIERFADSIGVDVDYHWGVSAELMTSLEKFEIDVAAAGFRRDDPWKKHVGFTLPYDGDKHVLAVAPGENALLMKLEQVILETRRDRKAGTVQTEEGSR